VRSLILPVKIAIIAHMLAITKTVTFAWAMIMTRIAITVIGFTIIKIARIAHIYMSRSFCMTAWIVVNVMVWIFAKIARAAMIPGFYITVMDVKIVMVV